MNSLSKISADKIYIGVCFSEPVYFDDGKSMFLAANKPARPYHITALKQWHIPFLLTNGQETPYVAVNPAQNTEKVSELEDLEDAEPIEELEEL